MPPKNRNFKNWILLLTSLFLALVFASYLSKPAVIPLSVALPKPDNLPSSLAVWPWPLAEKNVPFAGVTHWHEHSSKDGTLLDLWEFNFKTNSHRRYAVEFMHALIRQ